MEWLDYCKTFIHRLKDNYRKMMGHELNLEHPELYTEKIQWLKIYDSTFIKSYLTDKINLHKWCKAKLGVDLCIPILQVCGSPEQINFDALPNAFVIKCNHGSGMNIVVKDKGTINRTKIVETLNKWLHTNFAFSNGCELHYAMIEPRILIEKYMAQNGHSDLTDYKIHCFNGNPIWCQVFLDRHTNKTVSNYSLDWAYSPEYDWIEYPSVSTIKRPFNFDKMVDYSRILAADFKICRCDFYEIDGKLYLGELTFTPDSGYDHFKTITTNKKLGDLLHL